MTIERTTLQALDREEARRGAIPQLQESNEDTFEELQESRDGSGRGIFGSQRTIRRGMVTTGVPFADPILALNNISRARGGIRLGDAAPWADDAANGMVALHFDPVRRWSPRRVEVWIFYGVPVFFPTLPEAWELIVEGSEQTEDVEVDLDGRPIGTPTYTPIASGASGPYTVQYPSGPITLEPPGTAETTFHFTERATRTRDAATLTFTKRIGGISSNQLRTIFSAANTVNSDNFNVVTKLTGNIPITLGRKDLFKFLRPRVQAEPGWVVGQQIPGQLVRLYFAVQYDEQGHDLKVTHRRTNDKGERAVILLNGEPITVTHRMYRRTNFSQLFGMF